MQTVYLILGGAANSGATLSPFASQLMGQKPSGDGSFVLHVDMGPDRSARMKGAGFLDTTKFLPDGVQTVKEVYDYVATACLPDPAHTPLRARVESEMSDPEVMEFVNGNQFLPVDKGGFALPKWVRILYESLRPKIFTQRVEAWMQILTNERAKVGIDGEFEVEIVTDFGGGGGAGVGLEKYFPADEAEAARVAFLKLQEAGKVSHKASIACRVVRIMVGYWSYQHIRDSDGRILQTTKDDIFGRCDATVQNCLAEGRSLIVLSEEGSVVGPALFHTMQLAADYDRVNLNHLRHDDPILAATMISSRTVTPQTLTRITLTEVDRFQNGTPRQLLKWIPASDGFMGIGATPARAEIKAAQTFSSRYHVAMEMYAVSRNIAGLDQFVRVNGIDRSGKEACLALLQQYQRRLEAVLNGMPADPANRLFITDYEAAIVRAVLNLPVVLPHNFLTSVPTGEIEFGNEEGVFFDTHFTHDRATWTGDDYVCQVLIERGPRAQFGKTMSKEQAIWASVRH